MALCPWYRGLHLQQAPQQETKLLAMMCRKPWNCAKRLQTIVSIMQRSGGYLTQISASPLCISIFTTRGLCCSKHIAPVALSVPPWGCADWGRESMLRSNRHRCVDSAPGQRAKAREESDISTNSEELLATYVKVSCFLLTETHGTTTDWPCPLVKQCSKVSHGRTCGEFYLIQRKCRTGCRNTPNTLQPFVAIMGICIAKATEQRH